MKKKFLAALLLIALTFTFFSTSVYALEANRDADARTVKGGDVSSIDDLLAAFAPYAEIHEKNSKAIVLRENVKVEKSVVIKKGDYEIYGHNLTVFRGKTLFGPIFVIEGMTTDAQPSLKLNSGITLDGMCDKTQSDNGLVQVFGLANFEAEEVNFVNSTSNSEIGGAICIKTYETQDDENMPLGGTVLVKKSKFENCIAPQGGAIAATTVDTKYGGSYSFDECEFINNKTTSLTDGSCGGAIYITSGALLLRKCTFKNNTSYNGGAIYSEGDFYDEGSVYQENSATGNGGAMCLNGNAEIRTVELSNHTAGGNGGAIYARGKLTVSGMTLIQDNKATLNGGGVFIQGNLYFESGNIMNNVAEKIGGGVCQIEFDSKFEMKDGEIAGNKAKYCGGLYTDGSFKVSGAIGNSISDFPQIYVGGEAELGETAIIKDDVIGLQVGEYEGEKRYPYVQISKGLASGTTLTLAYVDVKLKDGEIYKFKNVTKGGECAVVANEKIISELKDVIKFKSRGLLSYKLDELGEISVRFVFLPIWVWVIIGVILLMIPLIIFRNKLASLIAFITKKPSNSKRKKNKSKSKSIVYVKPKDMYDDE